MRGGQRKNFFSELGVTGRIRRSEETRPSSRKVILLDLVEEEQQYLETPAPRRTVIDHYCGPPS